jgi:hypothetical protein
MDPDPNPRIGQYLRDEKFLLAFPDIPVPGTGTVQHPLSKIAYRILYCYRILIFYDLNLSYSFNDNSPGSEFETLSS